MKTKYSPVKLTIIIFLGFIMFGIFGYLYEKNSYTETWIVCEFPDKYDYYSETIKFRFKNDEPLYGFYREETFLPSTDMTLDEREEYFLKVEEGILENDNFDYEVTNDGNKVVVKTYMNVQIYAQFFEQYISELGISYDDTIEEIETAMKNKDYSCKISRK